MGEGWRQVWLDILSVLRRPVNRPELRPGEESNRQGSDRSEQDSATASNNLKQIIEVSNTQAEMESDSTSQTDLIVKQITETDDNNIGSEEDTTRHPRKWWMVVALVMLFGASLLYREKLFRPRSPSPGVVVTFDGGQITIDDIRMHLDELYPEESLQSELRTVDGYLMLAEEMVTDELVRRWSETRDVQQEQDLRHVMEHIEEDINLGDIDAALHDSGMGVSEEEVQSYFEANREFFGEQTLTQARSDIRALLESQQEGEYVEQYMTNLRANASITSNMELLEVPEPSELDYREYYSDNEEQFQLPARTTVDEIRIPVGDDVEAARDMASQALIRLRSGEALSTVGAAPDTFVTRGLIVNNDQIPPSYDEVLKELDYDEVSEVFLAGESFYILRLISKEPQRKLAFSEVKPAIRQIILPEIQEQWFESKSSQTLLTVNGRRLTAGEFWQEFKELPSIFASEYQGVSGWKLLAERLVDRLLLLEDSSNQLLDSGESIAMEEAKIDVLFQMMEQEEVDDRIEITDQELRDYYEEVKEELVEPPKSRIRLISIQLGQTEDQSTRAWDKANEAYKMLVPGLFQEGSDFADVAREYSEDETTAAKGGLLQGWIGEGPDLFAEFGIHDFHQKVLALDIGEISRPFEWNGAIYIIQVTERTEVEQLSFEDVEHLLGEEMRARKHEELRFQLSQGLLEQNNVVIYEKELKAAFAER
jgi:parvulin-like peptidyl-prolyl isomerase